ncbi:MAG: hypothetical protein F6K41_07280 [Symploca sp. SIO3E6]|nr:hypothetical protein [Caldora sp. SIO3E6]
MGSTLNQGATPAGVEILMNYDGIGLAELVKSGQVSPTELVEASIQAIEALDGEINAIPMRNFEDALDRASSIRRQGPFAGVPFSIKDTANVAGLPSAMGNKFFAEQPPPTQSYGMVRLYEAAGLIVLGKTNTPELSLIPTTEGGVFGTNRNPWNLDHSAGGSSGGAAAAVAAGYMPVAHGTDGAGSIRIPGSHCGVFGFKAGRDRVFPGNTNPRFAFDHVLSRSVRDCALSLAVTQDRSPEIPLEWMEYVQRPSARRLKIGFYCESYALSATSEVKEAVLATARLCQDLGHEVIETKQIIELEEYEKNYIALFARTILAARRTIEEATGKPIEESGLMNRFTIEFGNQAEDLTDEDFEAAENYFLEWEQKFNNWMTPFDVFLTPVMYAPAPEHGFLVDESLDYEVMSRRIFDFVSFVTPMNVFGLPGMSVPLAWSMKGLPIGSHFFAKYGQEAMLLELAYELEAEQPWANKWAPNSIANL